MGVQNGSGGGQIVLHENYAHHGHDLGLKPAGRVSDRGGGISKHVAFGVKPQQVEVVCGLLKDQRVPHELVLT
jgi:hypothetical protein